MKEFLVFITVLPVILLTLIYVIFDIVGGLISGRFTKEDLQLMDSTSYAVSVAESVSGYMFPVSIGIWIFVLIMICI